MRKRFLISVAAFGAFAAPVYAADITYPSGAPPSDSPLYNPAPTVTGHLEGGIGLVFVDAFSGDAFQLSADDPRILTAFGRANIPLYGGTWNFEAEIGGVAFVEDHVDSSLEGIGHIWVRSPAYSGGVFGGATQFFGIGVGTVGIEGEAYFGNVTLGAQGSYNWSDNLNFWGIRGYADWYVNPDLRVGGDVQYWSEDADVWLASADVEKRFTGTPVSLGGSLAYLSADGEDAVIAMLKAGIYLDPAGTTLQQADSDVPFDFDLIGLSRSDRRLKTDIVQVGMLTEDIPLYRFRYLWSDEVFVGVMAQDLLALRPDAVVVGNDGFLRVDYSALGTRMMRWDEWKAMTAAGSPRWTDLGLATAG